jgi:hypothetical protein
MYGVKRHFEDGIYHQPIGLQQLRPCVAIIRHDSKNMRTKGLLVFESDQFLVKREAGFTIVTALPNRQNQSFRMAIPIVASNRLQHFPLDAGILTSRKRIIEPYRLMGDVRPTEHPADNHDCNIRRYLHTTPYTYPIHS